MRRNLSVFLACIFIVTSILAMPVSASTLQDTSGGTLISTSFLTSSFSFSRFKLTLIKIWKSQVEYWQYLQQRKKIQKREFNNKMTQLKNEVINLFGGYKAMKRLENMGQNPSNYIRRQTGMNIGSGPWWGKYMP